MFRHISEAMSKRPNDWCAVDFQHNLIDRDYDLKRLSDRLKENGLYDGAIFCKNWGRAYPDKYQNMKMFYLTFGQVHSHVLPGLGIFNKDCVAVIRATDYATAREKAFTLFSDKWSNMYSVENPPTMEYYPRGLMEIEYDLV